MDGARPHDPYLTERRRRLAAERRLHHVRRELARTQSALVAHADRLSRRYLAERETNLRLSDRQDRVAAQRREAADRADRARRRLWHALETMRDGFALFDAGGRMVAANSTYLALFDADGAIGPGCTVEALFLLAAEEGAFVLDDGVTPEGWTANALSHWHEPAQHTQLLRSFDGRTIRLQNRRAPDGDVVSLAVDITADRAREGALERARDEAEATARAKQDFLSRMSHEMRTPMNGVLGMAEMLMDRDGDPEAQDYARTIRDSAEALLRIVNDTLDVSRLEAGRIELRREEIDLEAMLIDCVRLVEAAGARVPVLLDYPLDAPTRITGDAGRIRQIVTNILGNACKFTDSGHVELVTRLTPGPDGVELWIEVRDTGPGIPPEARQHVFDAFAQVTREGPRREGTGLGLTISRGLAERMGGTLRIVEREGPGTWLRLTLTAEAADPWPEPPVIGPVRVPEGTGQAGDVLARRLAEAGAPVSRGAGPGVAVVPVSADTPARVIAGAVLVGSDKQIGDAARRAAAAILVPPVSGASLLSAIAAARQAGGADEAPGLEEASEAGPVPHVLIADDNATNRLLLEKMLGGPDWSLELVADGAQAVAAYAAKRPDIVLMDISMPVMDGFEALAAIRSAEGQAGRMPAPVLALTAYTGEEMSARLAEAGFAAHQTKPVRKPALLEAMRKALGAPNPQEP